MNKIFLSFSALIWSLSLFGAELALPLQHSIDLDDFKGKTFLQTMLDKKNGIKTHLDQDYVSTYTFASADEVVAALNNFDAKIVKSVLGSFNNGKQGVRELAKDLEGQEFSPANIVDVLRENYRGKGNIYALSHFFGMASNAGTVIRIDDDNYFYNFGYKSGEEADDVKSGRSYGASPLHNANDASDVMYLNELEAFLTSTKNVKSFYTTLLQVLTQTETSGFSQRGFSDKARAAATDFVTIYTAELDRHIMVDLRPSVHPWENDLAEATFVSIYSAQAGLLIQEGELKEAPLKAFWAMSTTGSGRSGIGIGRKDRRHLQTLISNYERENNPDVVEAVEALIGTQRDGDLFRGLMEYLNDKDNQKEIQANAEEITQTFVAFLMQVQQDVDQITEAIQE
ncbi:MAG: hypothetical protein A2X86_22240 [Bdellovibrionales bacterium GWA2_49_15]|nr:MAG: hypothetical protein A2X86_22240 [Bdellovibrionales bacterium GWA2_49_15]HAZ14801.1 hypothetical protein [Bdellovibrionales bacterium]